MGEFKKDKCVMFATSSAYVMGVANVIIGIEKYSPGLIDDYVIFYNENDPIKETDIQAFMGITTNIQYRKLPKDTALSEREQDRYSSLLLAKFHIFDLLEEYKYALYLEADMLVQGDISDIFTYGPMAWMKHPYLQDGLLINGIKYNSRNMIYKLISDKTIAPHGGVVLVNDEIKESRACLDRLYQYVAYTREMNIGINLDEVALAILAEQLGIKVSLLPERYNFVPLRNDIDDIPIIIHAEGSNKFWNDRLLNIFYSEWNVNNELWKRHGGSRHVSDVGFHCCLGKSVKSDYEYFSNILNYHMGTDEHKIHLCKILDYAQESGSWNKKILTNDADVVCAYGLGQYFEDSFELWNFKKKFNVKYCCDRKADVGKEISKKYGLGFVEFSELLKLSKTKKVVVILFLGSPYALQEQFTREGLCTITAQECVMDALNCYNDGMDTFDRTAILSVYDFLADAESKLQFVNILAQIMAPQMAQLTYAQLWRRSKGAYYGEKFIKIGDEEVLCDCGAYIGDSIEWFMQFANEEFKFIYAYEIAEDNFAILKENMKCMERYVNGLSEKYKLVNAGVWEKTGEIQYGKEEKAGTGGYTVLKNMNTRRAEAVTIDETVDMPVTFIKMNIEGAELNALRGAEKTIKKYHPTLAVNISHRLPDMWLIPAYIKQIVPEYDLYVRHTNPSIGGTILYAILNRRSRAI